MWISGKQKKRDKRNIHKELFKDTKGFLTEKEAKRWIVKYFKSNISDAVEHSMGVKLFPFQEIIIKTMLQKDYVLGILSRGVGKSFSTAIYAGLEAMLTPNCRIAIISRTFRQSRLLFQTLEDISYKPEAALFSESLVGKATHANDQWTMKFDNGSMIAALPLGDGCQVLDTQVLTKDSVKTFNNYMPHDLDVDLDHQEFTAPAQKIWSNGKFRETDQQFYNGIRDIKYLTTKKGFKTGATLNHKFKTTNGQNIIWKATEDYAVGDPIMIDRSVRWHSGDTDLTEDECYAFGAITGGGHITSRRNSYIGVTADELDIVKSLRKGTPFEWARCTSDTHWYDTEGQEARGNYLARFNYSDREYWKAENKHIPQPILSSSKRKVSAYIRGLMDSDGNIRTQTKRGDTEVSVVFYSPSERLVGQLQFVLLHYGIVANKTPVNELLDETGQSISYELSVTGGDVKTYAEQIGFNLKRKQGELQKAIATIEDPKLAGLEALCSPDIYFDTIETIKDDRAPTADLHVPSNHEYCANGFFSHNSKLRGFRFNCIIIDEMLLMPEKVLNEVIMPFLSTNANVKQRSEAEEIYAEAIKKGIITEAEFAKIKKNHPLFRNNKMIGLSSASYQFEYLYTLYKDYIGKITKGTSDGKDLLKDGSNALEGTYAIFQMSYDIAPKGLYNESLLEKSKSEMSRAQFMREFGSQFTDESSGYFSVTSIDKCTVPSGAYPCIQLRGKGDSKYAISVDPNASESDTSDFFAMVLFRIEDDGRFTQVHTYGLAGAKYSDHIRYFHYLLKNFDTHIIVMDNAGGIQFLRACQESKLFKDDPVNLGIIEDVDLSVSGGESEGKELKKFKKAYNKAAGKIVYFQKFNADWARQSNEDLQFSIDSGQIKWASELSHIDAEFQSSQKINIGIESLVFTGEENIDFQGNVIKDDYDRFSKTEAKIAKQIDFIEHQEFLMTLTRRQIASIEPSVSSSGNSMQFVLPKELQNQKGKNRARRDLYTAVLMANWVIKKYNAMLKIKEEREDDWLPIMINN